MKQSKEITFKDTMPTRDVSAYLKKHGHLPNEDYNYKSKEMEKFNKMIKDKKFETYLDTKDKWQIDWDIIIQFIKDNFTPNSECISREEVAIIPKLKYAYQVDEHITTLLKK